MAVFRNIFLGLGSNLGDREKNLLLAIKKINEQAGSVHSVSSVYRSEPWGKSDQPEFLNQVIEIATPLPPVQLLTKLLFIENELGRRRTETWGPRTLDIDILFYGGEIINSPSLTVPHPAIADRKFVLLPLSELAPAFIHPIQNKTTLELLSICHDDLNVELFKP